jgi:hypothetical protein
MITQRCRLLGNRRGNDGHLLRSYVFHCVEAARGVLRTFLLRSTELRNCNLKMLSEIQLNAYICMCLDLKTFALLDCQGWLTVEIRCNRALTIEGLTPSSFHFHPDLLTFLDNSHDSPKPFFLATFLCNKKTRMVYTK